MKRVSIPGPMSLCVIACVLGCATALWAGDARAQDGETLTDRSFNVDLVSGPVLGSGQITGLGGAYTALSTGIDGAAWNPAAYASRTIWSTEWFDWDLSVSFNPGTIGAVDFDNDGRSDAWRSDNSMDGGGDQSFQYGAAGLGLQFGELGAGVLFRSEKYSIDLGEAGTTEVELMTFHYGAGYTLHDGQIVLGAGLRTALLSINAPQTVDPGSMQVAQRDVINFVGTGVEVGLLLRFSNQPWRLGVAARSPVVSAPPNDGGPSQPVNGVAAVPREVRLPWEVRIGLAWQLGARPLNRRWENPHTVRDNLRNAMEDRRRERAERQWQLEQREAAANPSAAPSTSSSATSSTATTQATPPASYTIGDGAISTAATSHILHTGLLHMPSDPVWWEAENRRRREEGDTFVEEVRTAERRRELAVRSLSREYVLLTGEAIMVGATSDGVGVESFLSGVRQTSGDRVSVGFRAGIELEPIAHWLKVRGGGYLEPSRYPDRPYRPHGTLGFDVRLFTWDLFGWMEPFTVRTGATLDAAQRYTLFGLNLGIWH